MARFKLFRDQAGLRIYAPASAKRDQHLDQPGRLPPMPGSLNGGGNCYRHAKRGEGRGQ